MDIPLYEKTSPVLAPNYQSKWRRKLLLNAREISKIAASLDKPWNVLLALEVLVNKWEFIKIKLGIGKLKRKIEKKQVLKERAIKQQMDREIKNY